MPIVLTTLLCAAPLLAQNGAAPATPAQTGPAPGSREAMWPAPTEEDWKKPVYITWQRTWEDAMAVSKETGKPIMVAINMDGEIASEHYAGIRYREPDFGKLFDPYVSVIASVYRHNPRDYDENGNRVLCPRFGSVTCGEHIAMEPIVYSQFLDQTRVSPRHIGVELDGTELYDVFYAFDVVSVFDAIREGIENREDTSLPEGGDKQLEDIVASRSVEDRILIEQRFRAGSKTERRKLLQISAKLGAGAPVELLRLALFGLDVEVASEARRILAMQRSEAAIDLIAEALAVPMPDAEREMLIGALEAMSKDFARAKSLSVTLRGLDAAPKGEEVVRLARALSESDASAVAVERYEIEARIEAASSGAGAKAAELPPLERAMLELERGEATLRLAVDPKANQSAATARGNAKRFAELRFRDARDAALAAEELGLSNWRTDAVVGLTSHYLGDGATTRDRILRSFDGMAADPEAAGSETATGWIGMAVLSLYADGRLAAVDQAVRAKDDWSGQWMTDANTAFDLLAQHPLGNDEHVAKHHDFLIRMGARGRAFEALDRGLERFRGSWALHARYRERLLYSRGVKGLHEAYDRMTAQPDATGTTFWYAGYAGLVAGEFRRRRSQQEGAVLSYDKASADFETAVKMDPSTKATADHYAAMALAGKAHARMEQGKLGDAANLLLSSFERCETASNALDGLNASAVTTSRLVLAKLKTEGLADDAARLQGGLDALDPALLKAPDFETVPNTPAARNRDRRGRQRPARRDRNGQGQRGAGSGAGAGSGGGSNGDAAGGAGSGAGSGTGGGGGQ